MLIYEYRTHSILTCVERSVLGWSEEVEARLVYSGYSRQTQPSKPPQTGMHLLFDKFVKVRDERDSVERTRIDRWLGADWQYGSSHGAQTC